MPRPRWGNTPRRFRASRTAGVTRTASQCRLALSSRGFVPVLRCVHTRSVRSSCSLTPALYMPRGRSSSKSAYFQVPCSGTPARGASVCSSTLTTLWRSWKKECTGARSRWLCTSSASRSPRSSPTAGTACCRRRRTRNPPRTTLWRMVRAATSPRLRS